MFCAGKTHGRMDVVNLKRHRDRLDILLARYEREIREAEEELRRLKTGHSHLNFLAQESDKPANPQSGPDKSRDVGITKAVLDALNDLWPLRKGPVAVTQIKRLPIIVRI
jgi:hypothetical protein